MANNDTTTLLNPGVGGDTMDESLVLQSDAVTSAKRPRVVIGGNAGYDTAEEVNDLVQPVSEDPGASPMSLPTLPQALVADTPPSYAEGELRPLSLSSEGRLRVVSVQAVLYADFYNPQNVPEFCGSPAWCARSAW